MGRSDLSEEDKAAALLLAEKVKFLFDRYRKENSEKYTYSDVERLSQGRISLSWISRLANGQSPRPGLFALKALTDFFGVEPSFWFTPLNEAEAVQVRPGAGSERAQQLALRASELSDEGLDLVMEVVEALRKRGKEPKNKL